MMLDDIEERKRKFQAIQRAIGVAQGKRKAALARLTSEFGVASVEEAKKLLIQLKKKEQETLDADAKAKERYTRLLDKHKDDLDKFLEDME